MQVEMIEPSGVVDDQQPPVRQEAANSPNMPSVVMAGPGDPPATEIASDVVDRAEIVGGKTLIQLSRAEMMVANLRTARATLVLSMATTKEAAAVRAFRALCVKERSAIAAKALDLRRPAIDFGKKVSAAEKLLIDQIAAMEKEADDLIKADEKRREDERIAKEKAAAERKKAIDDSITEIRTRVDVCVGQSAEFIGETIEWLDRTEVTEEDFGDRAGEALQALKLTRETLVVMKAKVEAQEAAAAAAQVEADRLAALAEDLRKREAALQRREDIAKRIDDIRALSTLHVESDSEALRSALDVLFNTDTAEFDTRASEAAFAIAAATRELDELLKMAVVEEAEPALEPQADAPVESVAEDAPVEEAQAKPAAAVEAIAPAPAPAPVADAQYDAHDAVAHSPSPSFRYAGRTTHATRPSDGVIVTVLAQQFDATQTEVLTWLRGMDFDAQAERIARGL